MSELMTSIEGKKDPSDSDSDSKDGKLPNRQAKKPTKQLARYDEGPQHSPNTSSSSDVNTPGTGSSSSAAAGSPTAADLRGQHRETLELIREQHRGGMRR